MTTPFLFVPIFSWPTAPGGKLHTYAAGGTTPQTTWSDAAGSNANTNPVTLDSNGTATVRLTAGQAYHFVLKDSTDTTTLWDEDNYQSSYLTATDIVSLTQPRTTAEIAAGVTPVNLIYPQGHLYRYGTNTTPGTTDMTAACNAWLSVGGNLTIPIAETVLVSSTLNLVSNTSITMTEGATIKCATANISIIKALSKSNIQIRGGTFQQTANGSTVHIGVIELNTCTNCLVEAVEIIGAQWHGILLSDSSNCTVRGNYIHNSLGVTVSNVDSCDISCYRASSFNVIEGNQCFGGTAAEHGIMIQDPGSSLIPLKNTVANNKIGAHASYGILNYLIDHANTWCQIIGNEVEGITGTGQSGTAGAGIYNQGAGGTVIANNVIRNCCISTTSNSLTPAGIGLNLDATMEPVTVSGNGVFDMANWYGIEVVNGGANIVGNTIRFSSAVSGTNTNATGIYLNAASNVTVQGNFVSIDNSISNGQAIFVYANGVSVSNISVSQNFIPASILRGIRIDQSSGSFTLSNITVNGNNVTGGAGTSVPLQLAGINGGTVTGNFLSATTVQALDVSACTNVRYANNFLGTTGTKAFITAGTCTGSYYDKTNIASTALDNAATGLISEQLGSAAPASSTFHAAVGDRVEQSVPVVGNPKGWRCTVAGNPGTWVSEGNL